MHVVSNEMPPFNNNHTIINIENMHILEVNINKERIEQLKKYNIFINIRKSILLWTVRGKNKTLYGNVIEKNLMFFPFYPEEKMLKQSIRTIHYVIVSSFFPANY